jgi:hypothetical protein
MLYVAEAMAGAGMDSQAAAAIADLGERIDTMGASSLWQYGGWAAHSRDVVRLSKAVTALGKRDEPLDQLLASAFTARVALARADTVQAIEKLRRLTPIGTPNQLMWFPWHPLTEERLLLAELLLRRGATGEALRVADEFDHPQPVGFLPYLRASLALRIQAATALGRSDLALRYRTRLMALGSSASIAVAQ